MPCRFECSLRCVSAALSPPGRLRQHLSLDHCRCHQVQSRGLPGRQPSDQVRNRRHPVIGQEARGNGRAVAPSTLEHHGAVAGHGAELLA